MASAGPQINHLDLFQAKRGCRRRPGKAEWRPRPTSAENATKSMKNVSVGKVKCHGRGDQRSGTEFHSRAGMLPPVLLKLFTPLGNVR